MRLDLWIRCLPQRALFAVLSGLAAHCNANAPPNGPEALCVTACRGHALHCTERACARGCNLVIDRLVQNEGDGVIRCVSLETLVCDDSLWARCAARVGVHADGGPPAPPQAVDGPLDDE